MKSMLKKQNKKGFTLMEIIIVIIIVGVLASLALPKFFNTIDYSKSTEALTALGVVKRAIDLCGMQANNADPDYSSCSTFPAVGVDDPGTAVGASFAYSMSATSATKYVVTAKFTADTGSTIAITFDEAAATKLIRSGTSKFAAIK